MKNAEAGYTLAETVTAISLSLILVFVFSGFFYTLGKSIAKTAGAADEAFTVLRADGDLRERAAAIRVPYWEKITVDAAEILSGYSSANKGLDALTVERRENRGLVFRYRVGKKHYECRARFGFMPVKEET
ncbi:MAG: hypothetical protein LBB82_03815 [Treponema sp.]|nr:hypothetical protein [Treponema sp.]